jgi:protein-S-isoprenylcysteine O-methyltransferase Ste14
MAKDSPGVHLPPPLIYVALFFASIGLQRIVPLSMGPAGAPWSRYVGIIFLVVAVVFVFPALLTFLRSRNTLITFLPAKSLQTGGVYAWSRNPMYFGLLMAYSGLAFLVGNWWTLILLPVVVFAVDRLVILNEEAYLDRAFGAEYAAYKGRVRRWFGRNRTSS